MIIQVHLSLNVTVLELKTLRIRFSYIRSIDINEATTSQSRTTPVERVIQNLKSVQISERIIAPIDQSLPLSMNAEKEIRNIQYTKLHLFQ